MTHRSRGGAGKHSWHLPQPPSAAFGVFALTVLSLYSIGDNLELRKEIANLRGDLSATNTYLDKTAESLSLGVAHLEEKALGLEGSLGVARQEIEATKRNVGTVAQNVHQVSGTVSTLEKLSKTDPELLQKYSKVFFLNEHYVPERLFEIPKEYLYSERRPESVHALVWPRLQAMMQSAGFAGKTLYVKSGYRSYDTQSATKSSFVVTYGAGTANTFSADQGYSEHQLGTTVDFITIGLGGELEGFGGTDEYTWLKQNAHKYGFTLSYPEGNAYYMFEPWHWRFVGVELATYLYSSGKYFYDLDQREIDTYLVSLFD